MSKRLSQSEVQRAFLKKIELSGLTAKDAKSLKFSPTTHEGAKKLKLPAYAGFKIPYFDEVGKESKFYRFRYLEDTRSGFERLTSKKPMRYIQPAKTLNELYFPPVGSYLPWSKYLLCELPLYITEGELKSACATKMGFPTIGLGGVYSFKSSERHLPLLPQFKKINFKDRPVYIVYDSDAIKNPMVVAAENALARELLALSAQLYIVRLPEIGGAKTGLDDYLMAMGADKFSALVQQTPLYEAAQELHQLNEEVLLVRHPTLVLELKTLKRIAPNTFINHLYADRIFHEKTITEKGGVKLTEKSAAREWFKWPGRAQVLQTTYKPGEDRIVGDELNMWKGWAVEPKHGDIKPWVELLDTLFKDEPESRKWFEQWLAYPLQNPGTKMFSAAVLWGLSHGTGKSMIGYTMFRIYGENSTEIRDQDLIERHNEWAENKQFVMGDEITGGDKRNTADRMKSMITQQRIRLNPKYVPTYEVPDCINYYFTSNHPDAFFIEDGDRRFFIHEVRTQPKERAFYKRYEEWLNGEGPSALFAHLLELDLTGFEPKGHAPSTRSKRDMLDLGKSDLGEWVAALRNDPDSVLRVQDNVLSFKLWRSEDLLKVYDPEGRGRVTANGLSREMRRSGLRKLNRGAGCYTKAGQYRLWAIRERDAMEKLSGAELGAEYDRERELVVKKRKF